MINLFEPIPKREMPIKVTVNKFFDEPLVNVEDYSHKEILVDMQYFKNQIPGACKECYLRKTACDMLIEAGKRLPDGYRFLIFDAWRPFEVQKELYEGYSKKILEGLKGKQISPEELEKIISDFVSIPIHDEKNPPVHTTGGAVDLTIIDKKGHILDMGTEFDDFSDKAHTIYFEGTDRTDIANNRRLLYNVMKDVGFTNFPSEWWHFDYGTKFWVAYTKTDIMYKGIFNIG